MFCSCFYFFKFKKLNDKCKWGRGKICVFTTINYNYTVLDVILIKGSGGILNNILKGFNEKIVFTKSLTWRLSFELKNSDNFDLFYCFISVIVLYLSAMLGRKTIKPNQMLRCISLVKKWACTISVLLTMPKISIIYQSNRNTFNSS